MPFSICSTLILTCINSLLHLAVALFHCFWAPTGFQTKTDRPAEKFTKKQCRFSFIYKSGVQFCLTGIFFFVTI